MKKIITTGLLAATLLVGVNANAQEKKTEFGVKAGINLSNMRGPGGSGDAKVGFNIGVTVDHAITESFYLQSGLELTTKGSKMKEDKVTYTNNLIYLQLPIHAAYKLSVSENTKVVFFAGPYLAYGVGGKNKESASGIDVSTDVFQKGYAKRFDAGIGGGVGAEFGKIGVNLGYDYGLANINDGGDGSVKNQNAYLSVGYRF